MAAGDRQNPETSIRAHFRVRGIVAGSSRGWEVVMAGGLRQSEPRNKHECSFWGVVVVAEVGL